MTRSVLVRGATVVLPTGLDRVDVLVEGGRIAAIEEHIRRRVDDTIDASGLHLIPGLIDDQVHFREPGLEHKEDLASGSRACAKGGVTTFLEMPNTKPTTTTVARLHEKLALAATKSRVHFGFYIGATADNLSELQATERTPGIKIFIGSSTGDLLVDDQEALERIFAETALPICAHCEDEATVRANAARLGGGNTVADHSRIRDERAAVIATARALDLARRHQHRFHVLHVSTAGECELLRDRPPWVSAEACPHHLLLDESDYERLGTKVQMNPSLKTSADREALWVALGDGRIEVVATDHAPHTLPEKALPYPQSPSGLPAVENLLALLLDQVNRGRCSLEQVVAWTSANPARIWDLAGKGRIEVGADADLVLVDLAREATVRDRDQVTKCGWSPWDGTHLAGWPVRTLLLGDTVWHEGRFDETVRGREVGFVR